ncbi:X-Pro aminopeptidase [Wickerhamomyces ciferrii]|uniref:Xaa-Pro aminopeptidase n=1 Tax=Wickerhamomyces ciferrii (strain ATCC 14091 / BCRC 22168 / CBS 111 / JCM 3599 / NBRC 0793 / NRRL Y-1031 F-60-10) TaxID=1206466 RepID=K0KVR4_WICCF|nr:X-Pro aminopeptidase [Wickerhamomyces ciferrii]CCH45579.1 X-Pro aminopeptidase [Wickerhamomyces ciferrii]
MSNKITSKPSMFSLGGASVAGGPASAVGGGASGPNTGFARGQRPCSNCTCSPGLLSRQGRRTSLFMRQVNRRRSSGTNLPTRKSLSNESIYSSDSLCTTKNVNTTERLLQLRNKMKQEDLAVYIVPSEDEHQSEYVSSADQRRSFISGFTGSAGIAIISRDLLNFNEKPEGKSALSTDGRYFNQATQELDYNWTLLRQGAKNEPTWDEWAINEAIEQSLGIGNKLVKIGIDPKVISYKQVVAFEAKIKTLIDQAGGLAKVELVPIKNNLIDEIWGLFEEQPKRPSFELIKLDDEFTGESYDSKLTKLQNELQKSNSKSILISALDEIAWFLNLRGSDIAYNPVFYSYLIINGKEAKLFLNNNYNPLIKQYFNENNIKVHSYDEIWKELSETTNILKDEQQSISIPESASWEIVRNLNNCKFKQIHSPIDFFKSIKNEVEIKNHKKAQFKDGLSLIKYFAWLEDKLITKEQLIDEYSAGEKLIEFRNEQSNYQGNSFETISSTGSNAAIIHYSPQKDSCSMIDPSKIYLCDSGSQFLEGTTDITRTLHFSEPTKDEINNYTYVLKGNLALENLKFPEGSNGYQIDVLARQFLWSQGLDYRHGTGHGVGSFLNVHEGPIGIGFRPYLLSYPLSKGNIITNEPGYYEDGKYGIRIENDMLVEETSLKFGDTPFLKFKNITLVPYNKKLINVKLLTLKEKQHINDYHKEIWDSFNSKLDKTSIEYSWLKRETSPI